VHSRYSPQKGSTIYTHHLPLSAAQWWHLAWIWSERPQGPGAKKPRYKSPQGNFWAALAEPSRRLKWREPWAMPSWPWWSMIPLGDHSVGQRNPYWEIISSGQDDLSGFWTIFKLQRCGRLRPDGIWVCSRHLGYSWSRLHASCAYFSGQPLEKLALWPSMATEIVFPVLGTFPNAMIQTFPTWIGKAMRLWYYGYSNWHNWNDSIFLEFQWISLHEPQQSWNNQRCVA